MASLNVSAVPYLDEDPTDAEYYDPAFPGPNPWKAHAPLWSFYVLVTDVDGTPKTGLSLANFQVTVVTQGHGKDLSVQPPVGPPLDASTLAFGLVALDGVSEQFVPGVYRLGVKQGQLTPPSATFPFVSTAQVEAGVTQSPSPSPIPYVFFVKVTIYSTRVRFLPPFGSVTFVQASGSTLASFAPDTDYTAPSSPYDGPIFH
jgi:hypothetical protein